MKLFTPNHRILGYTGALRKTIVFGQKRHALPERYLAAEWRAVESIKQAEEQPLRRALRRVLSEQQAAIMRGLRTVAARQWRGMMITTQSSRKDDITPLTVQTIIDWAEWSDRIEDAILPSLSEILEAGFDAGLERIALDADDLTSDDPAAQQALRQIIDQTRKINETTRDRLTRQIQQSLVDGRTVDEIIDDARGVTDELTGYRLERTVRTAANGTFEAGQTNSWERSGIKAKAWLSQRDARVRDPAATDAQYSHRDVDGQTVAIDGVYSVPGTSGPEAIQYPGDPQGSPGNIINCRCGQLPRRNLPNPTDE